MNEAQMLIIYMILAAGGVIILWFVVSIIAALLGSGPFSRAEERRDDLRKLGIDIDNDN